MRIELTLDLGEVEVETDSGHYELEHIWVNGEDFIDKTAEELVLACVGRAEYMRLVIAREYELAREKRR